MSDDLGYKYGESTNVYSESASSHTGGAAPWAVTFSDLALNMLCMFALMLSFSSFRTEQFQDLAGSMRQAFGGPKDLRPASPDTSPGLVASRQMAQSNAAAPDARSENDVRRFIEERGLSASVEVENTSRGVVLRVRDKALFDSGSADIRLGAEGVLGAVLELSRDFPGALAVEGHTDDRPIRTAVYPSNWELSAARAASVVRYLVDGGLQASAAHIAGYADLRPLTANVDAFSRARNRRVEFVFEAREAANSATTP